MAGEIAKAAGLDVQDTGTLIAEVRDLLSTTTELVNSANAELCTLSSKEAKACDNLLSALKSMTQVCQNGHDVVDCASVVVWYLSPERIARVSDQVRARNFRPLHDLLTQVNERLSHTEESYQQFSTSCEEAGTSISESAHSCREAAKSASTQKRKVQVGGGTGSALGLLAGVGLTAASIVAGIFTAGVSAVVVLSVGAGVAGAAGAVGAGVTAKLAKEYETAATVLGNLAEKFDTLCIASYQFQESLLDLKRLCDGVGRELTAIRTDLDYDLSGEAISTALDLLTVKAKELPSTINSCRSSLAAKREELAKEMLKK
jgi:uncharacterized phage infection (PIP) family protein YhgE